MIKSPTPASANLSRRLDRFGPAIAGAILGLYLVRAGLEAASKPLWFDEYFTFYLARLGFSDLWQALLGAADALPPLGYVLTKGAHALLGTGEVATRIPSILGMALFSCCVFLFVRRRFGVLPSLAAMIFPWLTWGFEYSIDARPYALMTGLSAAALLSWREATEGKRRRGLAGLALSLAGAISMHYYAVFAFLPPAVGEAVRSWKSRRVDWPIWGAITAGGLVLLAYLPLIHATRSAFSGGFWSPVHETDILGTYLLLLLPAAWPLGTVALILVGGAIYSRWRGTPGTASVPPSLPSHEEAAIVAASAIPFLAVALAYLTTGAYVYRYGLTVLLGLSVGFGVVVQRASRSDFRVQGCVVAALLGWFLFSDVRFVPGNQGNIDPSDPDPYGLQVFEDPSLPPDLPVVVASPMLFPERVHYAPNPLKKRFVYLADPAAALRYRDTDTPDRNLQGLGPWAGFNVKPYDEFLGSGNRFLILERPNDRFAWLLERLKDENRHPTLLIDGPLEIWECCGPDQ